MDYSEFAEIAVSTAVLLILVVSIFLSNQFGKFENPKDKNKNVINKRSFTENDWIDVRQEISSEQTDQHNTKKGKINHAQKNPKQTASVIKDWLQKK